MKKRVSRQRLGLGFALVILGLILIVGRPKVSPIVDTFASEPVTIEGFSGEVSEEDIPRQIIIPQLSIDLKIKKSKLTSGYWEVFPDVAGWGEGSGVPGKGGNQVIFAHARRGLFSPLKDVVVGTKVYVLTNNEWYEYQIEEVKEVFPNQTEVIAPTEEETLTLYTCSGFANTKRLIVTAKRV